MKKIIAVLLTSASICSAQEISITPNVITAADDNRCPPPSVFALPWSYVGDFFWSDIMTGTYIPIYVAAPISDKHILAQSHIGGIPGDVFTFQGVNYTLGDKIDVGNDQTVWRVYGPTPMRDWATLCRDTNVLGRPFVSFGRGTSRGPEVFMTNRVTVTNITYTTNWINKGAAKKLGVSTPAEKGKVPVVTERTEIYEADVVESRGYRFGPWDGVTRWGTNSVSAIYNGGEVLACEFNEGGPYEAAFSFGDSGGLTFVQNASGGWELLATVRSGRGPYGYAQDQGWFWAALYDTSGFYEGANLNYYHEYEGFPKPTIDFLDSVPYHYNKIVAAMAALP